MAGVSLASTQSQTYIMAQRLTVNRCKLTSNSLSMQVNIEVNQGLRNVQREHPQCNKNVHQILIPAEALSRHQLMVEEIWPVPSKELYEKFPAFAKAYTNIKSLTQPNCTGAQCHVPSALHHEQWDIALQQFHDREVCMYIKYGWPLGFLSKNLRRS